MSIELKFFSFHLFLNSISSSSSSFCRPLHLLTCNDSLRLYLFFKKISLNMVTNLSNERNLFHHHYCLHFFPLWIFGNSFPVVLCPFGPHGLFVLQCYITCFNARILSVSVKFKLKLTVIQQ